MACPYFYPLSMLDEKQWPNPPLLPLGDPYDGVCRAGAEAHTPSRSAVRDLCNQGYARGACAEFPAVPGADIVRWGIARDSGTTVRLAFITESDHLPHGHGSIDFPGDYSCRSSALPSEPHGEILQRQAEAYLESYLRRRDAGRLPA